MTPFDLSAPLQILGDASAIKEAQLAAYNAQMARSALNVCYSLNHLNSLAQYKPCPERPLDERFADFKQRLNAALAKRGLA